MDAEHNLLMDQLLLNYSDPDKGGAALLNPDGYTFYINPLLENQYWPELYNYNPGKLSYGEPDCTVNPYILFADNSPRRMFKTYDFFSRIFHIKPPVGGGPFEFGYVVSACWALPMNIPVTDPENDFPVEANCEDPYGWKIEQLQPISYDAWDEPVFKVTQKHRPGTIPRGVAIMTPTISTSPMWNGLHGPIRIKVPDVPDDVKFIDEETTEMLLRFKSAYSSQIGDELVSGWHLGILYSSAERSNNPPPTQLWNSIGVYPVMVYVEV